MKRHNVIGLALVSIMLCIVFTACFRKDVQTYIVTVPAMNSRDCVERINKTLAPVEGVMTNVFNIEQHTVAVTYDTTKLSRKNIEYLITGIGFDANGNQANAAAKAKLPEDCR